MNWIEWAKKAGIRAVKTFAQTTIAVIGLGGPVFGILDVGWAGAFQAGALAAALSLLTSLAGLPELDSGETSTSTHRKV